MNLTLLTGWASFHEHDWNEWDVYYWSKLNKLYGFHNRNKFDLIWWIKSWRMNINPSMEASFIRCYVTIRDVYDVIKTSIIKCYVNICEWMYIVPPFGQLWWMKKILMYVCELIQLKVFFFKTNLFPPRRKTRNKTRSLLYGIVIYYLDGVCPLTNMYSN